MTECVVCYDTTNEWTCVACPCVLCASCRPRVSRCPMCRADLGALGALGDGLGALGALGAALDDRAALEMNEPDPLFDTARDVFLHAGVVMDVAVWTMLIDHIQFCASQPAESMTSLLTLWQRSCADFLGILISTIDVFDLIVALRARTVHDKPDWLQWRFVDEQWLMLENMTM